ncbi:putative ABC transporter ATP-binding protein [compost metagenome]
MKKVKNAAATYKTLLRTIAVFLRVAPWLFFSLCLLKLLLAVIPSVQIYLTKELTDSVSAVIGSSKPIASCLSWLLLIGSLGITGAVGEAVNQIVMLRLQLRAGFRLESMLAAKAAGMPLIRFDEPVYYDQLQRARSNLSFRGFRILENIFLIGQSIFTVISFIILLGQLSWILAVAMCVVLYPSLFVYMKIGEWNFWLQKLQTPFTRKMYYFFELLTSRSAAKEIRIYGLADELLRKWGAIYWKNANEQHRVQYRASLARTGMETMNGLLVFLFSIYSIWICVIKSLSLGAYVATAQVIVAAQAQMRSVAFYASSIYEEAMFMTEFYMFIDSEDRGEANHHATLPQQKIQPEPMVIAKEIAVRNLSFSYPSRPEPVLKNISFTIKPGQIVAIVGENGAGKSTLVNCLVGLYREFSGDVLFDEVPIKDIPETDLRWIISAVFQDFVRFELSVKENIGYGDLSRLEDPDMLEAAASRSGFLEVIDQLPEGFETLLGPAFEGGQELSVGQWQKLALARSFVKPSQIIVLDEPTASMDPMAEAELFKRFAELASGKITFLISHRLASCRLADQILVLKDGELIEQGTHDSLMKRQGEYCRMYTTQAKGYGVQSENQVSPAY